MTAVRKMCWHTDVCRNASVDTYLHAYISKYNLIDIDVQVLIETELLIHRFYKSTNIYTYTYVTICINL